MAASSRRAWARRSKAIPGLGSRPSVPASRYAASASANSPAEPVQLALLVASCAERWVRRLGEPLGGEERLRRRADPVSVGEEHLRAVHQALPAVGHEIRLRRAPRVERAGPLRRAADVEGEHAHLDDRAVDDAGGDRSDLAGRHRDHRLVEVTQAAGDVAVRDQGLPDAHHPEGRGDRCRRTGGRCRRSPPTARSPRLRRPPPVRRCRPGRAGSHAPRIAARPRRRVVPLSPASRRSWPSRRGARGRGRARTRSGRPARGHRRRGTRGVPAPTLGRWHRPRRRGGRRRPTARGRLRQAVLPRPAVRTPRATNGGRTPRARARPGKSQPPVSSSRHEAVA